MSVRWSPFDKPWVIAHRGASGLLPEHCLPGYALAIEQGCDVIEPDLVASRDGQLFARHDLGLRRSTDVATRPEFSARMQRGADGIEDWWINDLEATEVDRLRAIQPWSHRPHHRDGAFAIPRFSAILDLLCLERRRRQRPIQVYPELKHPQYFLERGIDVVDALLAELTPRKLDGRDAPVLVQCFDLATLMRVRQRCDLRLILLCDELPDPAIPVAGFGIRKAALLDDPRGADFIAAAHARGHMLHAWTFRDDQPVPGLAAEDECARAFSAGCDGLFCDFPATGLRARARAFAPPQTAVPA